MTLDFLFKSEMIYISKVPYPTTRYFTNAPYIFPLHVLITLFLASYYIVMCQKGGVGSPANPLHLQPASGTIVILKCNRNVADKLGESILPLYQCGLVCKITAKVEPKSH